MASVTLERMTKVYGGGAVRAVNELTLDIEDGEFLVLVGPSGCGKSTALRMIAGLEEITDGGVWIGESFVNDVHPKDRDIAMVFQNYALYPHMSVFDNIAFPLQIKKVPKTETDKRVHEAARILELEAYLKRRPGQLSGGQRQRVAMGRAIVRQPAVYLMDEPLSNLDAKLRVQMRAEIAQLQHRLGTTMIYVTHDQIEAMTMGHRVALMRDGILQQVDTPQGIYNRPRNLFVAAFIGAPTMNLFHAELGGVDASATVRLGTTTLTVPAAATAQRPGLSRHVGKPIVVGFRPEDVFDPALRPDLAAGNRLRSTADLVEALGSDVLVHFGIEARAAQVVSSDSLQQIKSDAAGATSPAIARLTPRSDVRLGGPVELVIDTERLHFFDPETGDAITT
jgi:multiple sugar transport system ATP-binding protein